MDVPSTPKNFTVTDITETTVTLTWETPEDDGGSPITGYAVERRDASRRAWQTVKTVTDLSMLCDNLVEDNSYVFRVSAVNQYGTSEPVELASPVTPKSQYGEY